MIRWQSGVGVRLPDQPPSNFLAVFNKGSFVDGSAWLKQSDDGQTFSAYPGYSGYTPVNGIVGIPCFLQVGGALYMFMAQGITTTAWHASTIECAKWSPALVKFVFVCTIDCSALMGASTTTQVWPTYGLLDDDGSVSVVFEYCTNAPAYNPHPGGSNTPSFTLGIITANNPADLTAGWGAPVAITGTFGCTNQIDGEIHKIGSTYYLPFKNDDIGQKHIEIATSSSRASGYTMLVTGNGLGLGAPMEAPRFRQYNGIWYAYTDKEGAGTYRAQSNAIAGSYINQVLCTDPAWTGSWTQQHGDILYPNPIKA